MNRAEKRGLRYIEKGQGVGPKQRAWVSYESMGGERLYIEVPASPSLYHHQTRPVLADAKVHYQEPKKLRKALLPSEVQS